MTDKQLVKINNKMLNLSFNTVSFTYGILTFTPFIYNKYEFYLDQQTLYIL